MSSMPVPVSNWLVVFCGWQEPAGLGECVLYVVVTEWGQAVHVRYMKMYVCPSCVAPPPALDWLLAFALTN